MISAAKMLSISKSEKEVRDVINYVNLCKPEGKLRRRLLRLAKDRIKELNASA